MLNDNFISGYIDNIAVTNKPTAHEYLMRLNSFRTFILEFYIERLTVDEIVTKIGKGSEDPYTIIRNYAAFLQRTNNISNSTLKFRVVTLNPTLNKKKIAILSILKNNNDTIYVNENLELMDKLTSVIITLAINYDGYEDVIAGDRSGNLYLFTSHAKYENQGMT